jgi:L-seryl-tRNA(Ser) seleniumtransferase
VIVDASLAVPPPDGLTRFVAAGADLVAYSGGKWLGGPPATGFLAGRADLLRSVALQHLDMDVQVPTWWGAPLIERGLVSGPPEQGIGRGLKVGKEQVAGLLAALRRYAAADHAAEQAAWHATATAVVEGLAGLPVAARVLEADGVERGYPVAELEVEDAFAVVRALAAGEPSIALDEALAGRGVLRVTPTHLREGEAALVAEALRREIESRIRED